MTISRNNTKTHDISWEASKLAGDMGEEEVEEFINDVRKNPSSVEIKTDFRISETGNHYIEQFQWSATDKSDIRPSGINTTEAKWWIIVSPLGAGLVVIKVADLKELIAEGEFPVREQPITNRVTNASQGVLVPIKSIMMKMKLAKYTWKCNCGE